MRTINKIILHCTATPEGRNHTLADVRRWHLAQGFSDIGYHYLITLDGVVWEGRPLERIGAHCKGHNTGSVGVCYVGGLAPDGRTPRDTRTPAQRRALRALVTLLLLRFPRATVHGHCEFAAKACPSFDVKRFVSEELNG